MKRLSGGLATVLLLGLALGGAPAVAQQADPLPPGARQAVLDVTGEGRVRTAPDMATIRMGVAARADTPGAAVDGMRATMSDLLRTLGELGLDPADVQTSDLALRPVYDSDDGIVPREGPRIVGYEASSDVSLTVRDLDGLGEILDGAIAAGSNRFDGLTFGLSDPRDIEDRALEAAVADALRKAGVLAEAAGQDLGPLVALSDSVARVGPGPMMREMALSSDAAIAPGSVETQATVTARFALVPRG